MTTGSVEENPFNDPLAGRYGEGKDMGELMASLTDEEMLDYIRGLNWRWERQENLYNHWWIGKKMSAGERELERRGLGPYSWQNAPPEIRATISTQTEDEDRQGGVQGHHSP